MDLPRHVIACLIAAAATVVSIAPTTNAATETYRVVGRIHGAPTALWDYAFIDANVRRLYLAMSQGVMTLDLRTNTTAQLVKGGITHGVVPLGGGLVAAADATVNAVEIFDGQTGQVTARIPTGKSPIPQGWHNPDALVLDPKTGLLVAANGDSGTLVLIDIKKRAVVGSIFVGGKLEFPDVDGSGTLYINAQTRNAIAVLDIPGRKVDREIPLRNCDDPSGLAYDSTDRLIISVCENGLVKFLDASSNAEVASLPVGKGADALLYDPARRVVFVPAGLDGTLSVITIRSSKDIAVIQVLKTQQSARLGAIDASTGQVYLPVVQYDTTAPPVKMQGLEFPQPIPSTFEFLVIGPK